MSGFAHEPSVSLCLDDLTATPQSARTGSDGKPYLFIWVGANLHLWSYDPAAFRGLAAACIQAADALEAAQADTVPAVSAVTS